MIGHCYTRISSDKVNFPRDTIPIQYWIDYYNNTSVKCSKTNEGASNATRKDN